MAVTTAKNYPVKYVFGYSKAYGGWHSGVDRPMPTGTPIFVNTIKIGLSGNTGYSTGPHLHISKLDSKGNFLDPGNEGFTFYGGLPGRRPRVLATGKDTRNGKWVKIQNWNRTRTYVYCHLDKVTCVAGERIK